MFVRERFGFLNAAFSYEYRTTSNEIPTFKTNDIMCYKLSVLNLT